MPKIAISRENVLLTVEKLLEEDNKAWLLFKLYADSRKALEDLKTQLSSWKGITLSQEETKRVLAYILEIHPDCGSSSQAAIQTLKNSLRIYPSVEEHLYLEGATPHKRLYLQYQCSRVVDILSSENTTILREEISFWISQTISSLLIKDKEMVLTGEAWSWDFYNSLKGYIHFGEVQYQCRKIKNISKSTNLKSFMELYEIFSLTYTSFCKFQDENPSFVKSYNLYPEDKDFDKNEKNFEIVLEFIEKIVEKDQGKIKGMPYLDVFKSYKGKGLLEALLLLLYRPDITSEQCREILKNLQDELYNSKNFKLDMGLREQVKDLNGTSKWSWRKDSLYYTNTRSIKLTLRASNDIEIVLLCSHSPSVDKNRIHLFLERGKDKLFDKDDNVGKKIEIFNKVMRDILQLIFFEPHMKRVEGNDRKPLFVAYDQESDTAYFLPTIKQLQFLNLFLFPALPSDLVAILYYNDYFKEIQWNRYYCDDYQPYHSCKQEYKKAQGNYVYHNHIDLIQYFIQEQSTECIIYLWQTNCFGEAQRKEILVFLKKASTKEEVKKIHDKLNDLNMESLKEGNLSFEKYFLKNRLTWLSENKTKKPAFLKKEQWVFENEYEGLAFLLTHEINQDPKSLRPLLKENPFIFKNVVHSYEFLSKEIILVLLLQLKKSCIYLDKMKELKSSEKTETPSQRIKRLQILLSEFTYWKLEEKGDDFFKDILAEFDDFDNHVENNFSFFNECLNQKGNGTVSFHFGDNPQNQDSSLGFKKSPNR